jgi:hypothetical protein
MVSRISGFVFSSTIRPLCGKSAIVFRLFNELFTHPPRGDRIVARDEITDIA